MSSLQWYNLHKTRVEASIKEKQWRHQYKLYTRDIEAFFNFAVSRLFFDIDCLVDKVNPTLTLIMLDEIPPKMMKDFCDKFGFYAPTVKVSENFYWREYKFVKKVNWEQFKGMGYYD